MKTRKARSADKQCFIKASKLFLYRGIPTHSITNYVFGAFCYITQYSSQMESPERLILR